MFERDTPVLIKARVMREREGYVEVQTADGVLVRATVDALIEDEATAMSDAAAVKKAKANSKSKPSFGFSENAL